MRYSTLQKELFSLLYWRIVQRICERIWKRFLSPSRQERQEFWGSLSPSHSSHPFDVLGVFASWRDKKTEIAMCQFALGSGFESLENKGKVQNLGGKAEAAYGDTKEDVKKATS